VEGTSSVIALRSTTPEIEHPLLAFICPAQGVVSVVIHEAAQVPVLLRSLAVRRAHLRHLHWRRIYLLAASHTLLAQKSKIAVFLFLLSLSGCFRVCGGGGVCENSKTKKKRDVDAPFSSSKNGLGDLSKIYELILNDLSRKN